MFAADVSGATRASEVDILSDGHRWRKYGEKVVKGDLNPRLSFCVVLCGLLFNLDVWYIKCSEMNGLGNESILVGLIHQCFIEVV